MKSNSIHVSIMRAIALVALTIGALFPASVSAQLVSTPLEPGVSSYLREIIGSTPERYSLSIVDNTRLTLQSANRQSVTTVERVADDQIRISGTVAGSEMLKAVDRRRIEQAIDHFNATAGVGTLRFDATTGTITLEHHVDPERVGRPSIARLIILVTDALAREQSDLAALTMIN